MPIKVEAAVVTQKRANASFNSDSVNINGKLLPREVIHNGYKGTGVMSGTVYFSLSSSDIEGFPDAAVAAFNECAEKFKEESCVPSDVITGYFKDSVYALGEMGHKSSELVSSVLYLAGNTVIMAKCGNTQLYTYSASGLTKVTPALFSAEDGAAQYGLCTFPAVSVGDVFLLFSAGVSQVLTDKDVDDICRLADGSVKKLVNLISKVASNKEGSGGISVIAVRISEADESPAEQVFGFSAPQGFGQGGDLSDQTNQYGAARENTLTDPYAHKKSGKSKKKPGGMLVGILAAVVILVLLACVALAMKIFGGTIGSMFNKDKSTTAAVTTTTELPTLPTTTTPATTTGAVTTTTPVTTTTAPTTTAAPSTTARSSTPTPSRSSSSYSGNSSTNRSGNSSSSSSENSSTSSTEPTAAPTTAAPVTQATTVPAPATTEPPITIPEELSRFEDDSTEPVVTDPFEQSSEDEPDYF